MYGALAVHRSGRVIFPPGREHGMSCEFRRRRPPHWAGELAYAGPVLTGAAPNLAHSSLVCDLCVELGRSWLARLAGSGQLQAKIGPKLFEVAPNWSMCA